MLAGLKIRAIAKLNLPKDISSANSRAGSRLEEIQEEVYPKRAGKAEAAFARGKTLLMSVPPDHDWAKTPYYSECAKGLTEL